MKFRPNSFFSRAVVTVALLWFTAVVLFYFAVHKPISPSQFELLREIALTALGWVGTLGLANLMGWVVLKRLTRIDSAERLVLQIGFGLGILSLILLGFGLAGAYFPQLSWLLVLIPLPISIYRLRSDLRSIKRPRASWLLAFIALAIVLVFLRALSPPTAWDSLVYHLTGPKLYLQAGRIHHEIDIAYLGFPKAGSMLFLFGLQLVGPGLAQLFHATFFGMTLILTPGLVKRTAPGRGGLAVAITIAVPSAALIAGWGYVEWFAAFGVLASYTLIRQSDSHRIDRELMAAAFFAAFALSAKYTSVWLVAALGLVVLLRGRSIRRLAGFLIAVFGFVAPYLLVNLLLTGNPVYPFFFNGSYWDDHRAFWYSRPGTGLSPPELLTAAWDASIWGLEGGFFEGHASYGATIGPLLLALIPLILLRLILDRSARRGTLRDLVIMSSVAYLGWLAQLSYSTLLIQSRLLFPALPFFAALATIGFDTVGQIGRWGISVRFVLGGLVAFVLALATTQMLFEAREASYIPSVEAESDYLERRLGAHYFAMQAVNSLEDHSVVRFLWEPRSYYCREDIECEPDALLDRWWHDRQHSPTVIEIYDGWLEEGVTHVLFNSGGAEAVKQREFDPVAVEDWEALAQFLDHFAVPTHELGDAHTLYELKR